MISKEIKEEPEEVLDEENADGQTIVLNTVSEYCRGLGESFNVEKMEDENSV